MPGIVDQFESCARYQSSQLIGVCESIRVYRIEGTVDDQSRYGDLGQARAEIYIEVDFEDARC